jgi:hypothetical protein
MKMVITYYNDQWQKVRILTNNARELDRAVDFIIAETGTDRNTAVYSYRSIRKNKNIKKSLIRLQDLESVL